MSNKSILLLLESWAKWTVLWWAPGDVMSSLNIQVWWWTGSFSQRLHCWLSNGLTLSFLRHKIDTKTACAFCKKTLLSIKSICHMRGFDLISALAPWQPSASWEVYCRNDMVFHVTLPICINDASLCGGTHNDLCFSSALLLLHRESDGKSQSRRREQNQ